MPVLGERLREWEWLSISIVENLWKEGSTYEFYAREYGSR